MGKIFEQFHHSKNENEAHVNQNFVIPFLTEYLGYSRKDITPERNFPAKDIFYGRKKIGSTKKLPPNQRPDYVVCIDDISNPKFVIESKHPTKEKNLDKHLPQLKSYALGVGVNLLVITNGNRLRIYDVNHLIFEAESIKELDIKFEQVKNILSKENQSSSSYIEILQNIDLIKSLGKTEQQIVEEEKRKRRLKISDFRKYLETIEQEFQDWQIPREFQSLLDFTVEQYPPDRLHRFQIYEISKFNRTDKKKFNRTDEKKFNRTDKKKFNRTDKKKYILPEVEQNFDTPVKIFIGPSGIGKTTLLKYMTFIQASACLNFHNEEIPVFIPLRNFGYNSGLKNLIIDSFERRGFNVSLERLSELLQKHTFIFLLDAFDEIQEKYLEDAKRELEDFVSRGKHKYIITSREARLIDFPRCSRFYVNELEESEIEHFLDHYLGSERYEFLSEVRRNGLVDESKNTLMLTLMIFLYKKVQKIPSSRTKVIGEIVEKIKEWEQSKGKRLTDALRWEIKEKILSELAYKTVETQENLMLSKKQADSVLLPLLDSLEENREICRGIDKNKVIDDLALTGIISRDSHSGMLSFWHRAFLNYFASKALADKYAETSEILDKLRNKIVWESIIIGSAGHLNDSTKFVESIRNTNLFLASACAIEAKRISEPTIEDIVSRLSTKCSSPIPEIRKRAIRLLQRFDPKYTREIFFDLLENNPYPYIRAIALEEIAKGKSKEAKETVYKLIDWDEIFTFEDGGTQGSIAKALSNFDTENQLKAIEIWRRNPYIEIDYDCRQAIRSIIREGRLTETVKRAIVDFYLEKENINNKWDKERGLAELLIEIGDENLVPELIENLIIQDIQNLLYYMDLEGVLASYKSQSVIEQLSSKVKDTKNKDIVREVCAEALSKSKGKVSLSIFEKLLEDKNSKVRKEAVKGLNRFSPAEVKNFLQKYLNDENDKVQYEVIRILGEKGLLVEFFEKNIFPPERFYRFNLRILLKQIRKYKLREMLPVLNWLKDQIYGKDDKQLIDVAHTYWVIGEEGQSQELIESFFHENGLAISQDGLADLAGIAPVFDSSYALEVIKKVFKFIDKFEDSRFYLEEKCIESLERIGTQEALDFLKNLAEEYAVQKPVLIIERTLRAINRLATRREEDWYINFIQSTPYLKRWDLNRAIEGLGIVGSEKSLPIIKEIAELHQEDEHIINTCFLSIEKIYTSTGVRVEITEEDLFKEFKES